MRFLLSNDDGVYADGLAALAKELEGLGLLMVVAPDRDKSGASKSLTLDRPLYVTKATNGFYSVNGTPTDCVHLALTGGLLPAEPDIVISGINSGANLGDDVLYSGTVAAATEGRFLGYPAIAVSLAGEECRHYQTAALAVKHIVKQLLENPLPPDMILNVNVPDILPSEIKGYQITRLGNRHRAEPVIKMQDPRDRTAYWIGQAGKAADAGEGTDFDAIHTNHISITPLQMDLTRYQSLPVLQNWLTAWEKELH